MSKKIKNGKIKEIKLFYIKNLNSEKYRKKIKKQKQKRRTKINQSITLAICSEIDFFKKGWKKESANSFSFLYLII